MTDDELRALVESNARSIQSVSNELSEVRQDLSNVRQDFADLGQRLELLHSDVGALVNLAGSIVENNSLMYRQVQMNSARIKALEDNDN